MRTGYLGTLGRSCRRVSPRCSCRRRRRIIDAHIYGGGCRRHGKINRFSSVAAGLTRVDP